MKSTSGISSGYAAAARTQYANDGRLVRSRRNELGLPDALTGIATVLFEDPRGPAD
jgi:hypothetical protein